MKIDHKGHTTFIRNTQPLWEVFLERLQSPLQDFPNQNFVVDVSKFSEIKPEHLKDLIPLSKKHKKNKKSFIVVCDALSEDQLPDQLDVVPSVLEAQDTIEMDEIERDLGF